MPKYFLLILSLCLNLSAWGQVKYEYRYWFDNDETHQFNETSLSNKWHFDANISDLSYSLHSLHFQVKDTAGIWSAPLTRHFVKMPDGNLSKAYFWFDHFDKAKQPAPTLNGKFNIDVSQMQENLHFFHYQINDLYGNISAPHTALFVKAPVFSNKSIKYQYWVDNDSKTLREGVYDGSPFMVDVSSMTDGFHIMHLQAMGKESYSSPITRMFIKIPQTEGVSNLTCICAIDGIFYRQEEVPSEGGVVNWNLDVSSLSQGLHQMQIQVMTPSGAATNIYEKFFFRTLLNGEIENMKFVYSIDGESYDNCPGVWNNGTFHLDLDVASLRDGLHRITYMMASDNGTATKMNTQYFFKTPVGGNGVQSYKYWLNDNENKATTVNLKERVNPFKLIKLLPVETCPIRSKCFHFKVEKDNKPMLYAKNDIHFQFFDASGHILDEHKQFVDYNVKMPVEELTPLTSNKRVYKVKPVNDKIYWFTMEAAQGDSLSIKADQACTMQIFSPSGKEVFHSSGLGCLHYNGCHAQENGTYYLAVHDATGVQEKNIAVDYQHIDKYDILRQNVTVVGNGGYTTVTFEGNGFDDLYAVDYVNANNDTIHCEDVMHISDAKVNVTANFQGKSQTQYDAIFHFASEDRVVDKCINVVEATRININVKEHHPTLFLRGTTANYTFKLTNTGNMTAYRVPVYIYIDSKKNSGIERIDLEGFNLPEPFANVNRDSLSSQDLAELKRLATEMDDSRYFIYMKKYDDKIKDTVAIRSGYFFVDIAPNTTKTIRVNVKSNDNVQVWMTSPSEMFPWTKNDSHTMQTLAMPRDILDHYCCLHDRIECVLSLLSSGFDLASTITDFVPNCPHKLALDATTCIVNSIASMEDKISEVYCRKDGPSESFGEKFKNFRDNFSLWGSFLSCIEDLFERKYKNAKYFKYLKNFNYLIDYLNTQIQPFMVSDCIIAFGEKKPGCPPDPPQGGGSTSVNSFDPNDIIGYLSKSGSHSVKKGLKELHYTIEFENDTTFATSNALQVRIENKLDRKLFDMKSFKPTELKIGNKTVELEGKQNFITTVDMRPEIYAIAEVECKFDAATGLTNWTFTSLDPMTMEPTNDPMSGFLPVNNSDGDGLGEVTFSINLLKDFEDGTKITNQASIIFDKNEPIVTPVWTNVIDTIAPSSLIKRYEIQADSILLHFEGKDNRSGLWHYNVYVQMGRKADWIKIEEDISKPTYKYPIMDGIDYGFYVTATDSAGNVENKVASREISHANYILGDANGDSNVDVEDMYLATQKYLGNEVYINFNATDVTKDGVIDVEDLYGITQIYLSNSKNKLVRTKRLRKIKSIK